MPIGLYSSILKPFIIPLGFTVTATICLLTTLKKCMRGYVLCRQLSWQNFSFYFVLNLDTGPSSPSHIICSFLFIIALFPTRTIMLYLRLKLLQITNFHIRIKLSDGNSIKAIHIALIITLKIPLYNSCILRNNHTLYIPLQNSTFAVPILKPSDYLSDAIIHRTITLTVNNIVAKNLLYSINIFYPTIIENIF